MFDSHDRVLEKLVASGRKEFSLDALKMVMEEVWQEGAARHEQELMHHDPDFLAMTEAEDVSKLFDQLPPPQPREELEL